MNVMLKSLFVVISLGLFLPGCASRTATESAANVRTSADVVKVQAPPISIPAGGATDAAATLSILPGYHVNANPATFDYLIATELTADKSEGLSFGKPVYPAAATKKFQFAEEPLKVYEGDVQIKLPVTAAATAAKGSRSLALHLRVQACDEEKCFPPATLNTNAAVNLK
jgi:hypothetical protein